VVPATIDTIATESPAMPATRDSEPQEIAAVLPVLAANGVAANGDPAAIASAAKAPTATQKMSVK